MAEFCKCGSLIINEHCSNKRCKLSKKKESDSTIKAIEKASPKIKKTTKSPNPRKASKCITYNLYELEETLNEYTTD